MPYWNSRPWKYEVRCGARFEDLDRLRPHDVPPEKAVHRQRAPAREDLPQRQRTMPETPGRMPRLSDWQHPFVVLKCVKCGRHQAFVTADLRAGGDVTMLLLRDALTRDCPRSQTRVLTDLCAGLLVPGE